MFVILNDKINDKFNHLFNAKMTVTTLQCDTNLTQF